MAERNIVPSLTCGESPSTEQKHKHNKLAEVSKFFGGKIQTDILLKILKK